MLALSSCSPHCRPPIAHVPRPIVVISKSVLPRRRLSTRPSYTQQSVEKSILHVEAATQPEVLGTDRRTGPRPSVAEERGAFVRMVQQSLREHVRQNGEKGCGEPDECGFNRKDGSVATPGFDLPPEHPRWLVTPPAARNCQRRLPDDGRHADIQACHCEGRPIGQTADAAIEEDCGQQGSC